ncbi:hypothetical protein N7447_004165 [Penicillium robsamsonii]|uniref:uncharacterized protein n=1 Tax=Penicillium robsamsonii TaxID=1792511 RepID=UPI002548FA30|nr:uncharacterized protein N7447_004165 [Penicillium robsamsonii]KAJ5827402.1 hypothetical protein N7447_004165 [Penicillium robsamsonii]
MCHLSRSFSLSLLRGNPGLFEYTKGRFLAPPRRTPYLIRLRAACRSVDRRLNGVASITKPAEGGFNRVLQATSNDGYAVITRLPYKTTVLKYYAVASEATTLALLHAHGVLVPKVLVYSPDQINAVRTEHVLLK